MPRNACTPEKLFTIPVASMTYGAAASDNCLPVDDLRTVATDGPEDGHCVGYWPALSRIL